MFVLDTNILSQLSPSQTQPVPEIVSWIERNGERLFLSTISVMELSHGVEWLKHREATRKAVLLETWLHDVLVFYAAHILPVTNEVSLRAGVLLARARADGAEIAAEDALIAATADLRRMTVLTRNARHFRPMGIAHLNPFDQLPPETVART